jgi:hypothetical protein
MQKREELERLNHLLRNLTLLENQYDEVVAKEVELDKMVIDKFKNKKIISALIRIMQNLIHHSIHMLFLDMQE